MLPSSAELHYFKEVAHTLNISHAAERLGISQPSLSLAMKRLEESIGAPLFIRHKQGVVLTPSGKKLLVHVRQLMHYWEKTRSEALASQDEIQGHFTVGCNSIITIYMLSTVLPDLLEKHPKLEIKLKHDVSQKITERVNNLSIDIGIVINPIQHPDLVIRKIGLDETCFWVGPGDRDIQNIHSEKKVLLCNTDLVQTQTLLMKCKKKGILFPRIIPTERMEVIAHLTANGCGIGILPTRVVKAMYAADLKIVPELPVYSDNLCLIYRTENRAIKAIQTIVTAIMNDTIK